MTRCWRSKDRITSVQSNVERIMPAQAHAGVRWTSLSPPGQSRRPTHEGIRIERPKASDHSHLLLARLLSVEVSHRITGVSHLSGS